MGFYRIIKKTIRFILYQMPKKWLIMIIFALAMLFGLTNVQAYDYVSQNDIDFLDYIDLNGHSFNTGIHINSNSDTNCSFQLAFSTENTGQYNYIYLQGSSVSSYPNDITQKDMCGLFVNNSTNTQFFYNNVRYWDGAMNMSANTKYYIRQDKNVLYKPNTSGSNFVVANTFSSNFNNNNGYSFIIAPRAKAVSFKVFDFIIYNSSNGVLGESYHFYPAKYGSKYGFYESVNSNFYEVSGVSGGGINPNPPFVIPSITTTQSDIESYTFSNLIIDGGTLTNTTSFGQNYFSLVTNYMGLSVTTELDNFKTVNNNFVTFSVPKSELIDNPSIATGRSVNWTLLYYKAVEGGRDIIEYDLGTYTFDLSNNTQEENNSIQQDQTLGAISNVNNSINNLNNSINDLNNTQEQTNNFISDTNIDNSAILQPSVPQDTSGVETGVNNIFTTIMNAFINLDTTQSVVLPIPFTNKSITIPGTYTRDMLTSVNATWILTFINLIWWYLISRYIVKDILKMVDKIQEGNLDKVESSNIKGDML